MFSKKEKMPVSIGDTTYYVEPEVLNYIHKLMDDRIEALHENDRLKTELSAIKPIIETQNLSPAVSSLCDDCRYCVKSRWYGSIIGCRKHGVCSDFSEKE